MVREATNNSVSEIQVEIDRPADRARKQNQIGGAGESSTISVSGSGASGTLLTNNSAGAWYIERISTNVSEDVGVGPLSALFEIKNANGNVTTAVVGDVVDGEFVFGGVPILTEWSLDYTIEQADSNSYGINAYPIIRQPDPTPGSSYDGGQVNDSPVIDGFEDNDLKEYSGQTGSFSVTGNPTYQRSYALQADTGGNSGAEWIVSTSGLENYPSHGESFKFYVRSSAVGSSDDHRQEVWFAADGTGDAYALRFNWDEQDNFFAVKIAGGSTGTVMDEDKTVSGDYEAGHWYRGEVYREDTTDVYLFDTETDDRISTLSFTDTEYEDNDGIGMRNQFVASGESYYYDGLEML